MKNINNLLENEQNDINRVHRFNKRQEIYKRSTSYLGFYYQVDYTRTGQWLI